MRNKDYKAKLREKKKKKMSTGTGEADAKAEEPKTASRIKSSDYGSWDKFDVVVNQCRRPLCLSSSADDSICVFVMSGQSSG